MDSMNGRTAAEEVAAAEAEVRAAQARLDAARQRMASEQSTSSQVGGQSQQQDAAAGGPYSAAQQHGAQPDAYQQPYNGQPTPQQPYAQPYVQQEQPYAQQGQAGQPFAGGQPGQQYAGSQPGQPNAPYQQGSYGAAPQNPYTQQPYMTPALGEKDHVAAGLLAIFLGWLGVHKFYLGYNTSGFIMLGVSILGGIITLSVAVWAIWVIAIVEGIFYLTKSQTEFEQMYVLNKREWF